MDDKQLLDILCNLWDHVTDTGKEATRPVLTQIMKPAAEAIKRHKEWQREDTARRWAGLLG